MEISTKGIIFITKEEGLKLKPYLDSVGRATIGYGSTFYADGTPVKITDKPITKAQAVKLFEVTLKKYVDKVNVVIKSELNQNQFDACVSICYNIGVNGFAKSTLAKLINENPENPKIAEAFEMWKNAGGKPILLARRKRESALYFS